MTSRTPTTAADRSHHGGTARSAPEARARWWDAAVCRFFGPTLFFASDDETRGQRARRERTAKRICHPCPARADCLQHALATGETYGVWGGTTERERLGASYPADTVPMESSAGNTRGHRRDREHLNATN